jgi:hypothetical protein
MRLAASVINLFVFELQLHKTEQVARWCQWYLQVNFNEVIEKHAKTFEALDAETQATLLSKRWPPEWFVFETHFVM